MTVNDFAKAVHENAVAHGWYDSEITFPEIAVMVHSEISEAVEEWREGNPLVYGTCALRADECVLHGSCKSVGSPSEDCKPEGLAVELCDAVIRIFDYLAYMGVDIEAVLEAKYAYNTGRPYRHGGKKV